jgi:RNA polymerase sigma factor (sigma-70 family)
MKKLPEEQLIEYALMGNDDAWREIYRRHYGRVRRVVAWGKWSFKYSEIEEITQEVFLELIKALPKFRGEASLATFLTRLTKNKCISALRRRGAQKRAKEEYGFVFDERRSDEEEKWISVQSDSDQPEEFLVSQEDAAELMVALQKLSPECREIVKKRFFDDLSYKEICDELDLPLGTVCSRLKRCLTKLKKIFEETREKI